MLHSAVYGNNTDCLAYLLDNGGDILLDEADTVFGPAAGDHPAPPAPGPGRGAVVRVVADARLRVRPRG